MDGQINCLMDVGWIDGEMDGEQTDRHTVHWTNRGTKGQTDGHIYLYMVGWIDVRRGVQMDGWMKGLIDGCVDGVMD